MLGHSSPSRWTAPDGPWSEPDLHLFPQDGHRYEVVDGCLHVTPPADATHESTVDSLVALLRGAAPAGWWACTRLGIGIGASNLVPDVTVLRPYASGAIWNDPADVALVVEVETPASRSFDRLLKPALYAQAGIAAYWRVERDRGAPAVAVYHRIADGSYALQDTVQGADAVLLDMPFPVRLAPSTWR